MGTLKRRIIEDMEPTEEPPMEVLGWIPFAARMPEDGSQVLVSVDENYDDYGLHVCVYHDGTFERSEAGYVWGVTHWMPLPEPPEVK